MKHDNLLCLTAITKKENSISFGGHYASFRYCREGGEEENVLPVPMKSLCSRLPPPGEGRAWRNGDSCNPFPYDLVTVKEGNECWPDFTSTILMIEIVKWHENRKSSGGIGAHSR